MKCLFSGEDKEEPLVANRASGEVGSGIIAHCFEKKKKRFIDCITTTQMGLLMQRNKKENLFLY